MWGIWDTIVDVLSIYPCRYTSVLCSYLSICVLSSLRMMTGDVSGKQRATGGREAV